MLLTFASLVRSSHLRIRVLVGGGPVNGAKTVLEVRKVSSREKMVAIHSRVHVGWEEEDGRHDYKFLNRSDEVDNEQVFDTGRSQLAGGHNEKQSKR